MRRMVIAGLVLAAFAAQGAEFELKGITPGMSVKELKAKYPKLKCITKGEMPSCSYGTASEGNIKELNSLAGVKPEVWLIMTHGDRVGGISVLLPSKGFKSVVAALTEKFGDPKTTTESVQNRMGAKFDQHILLWEQGDKAFYVKSIASNLDTMSILLTDRFSAAQSAKDAKAGRKSAAGDL